MKSHPTSRQQSRINLLAQLSVDLIHDAKRLAELADWLADTKEYDEAERILRAASSMLKSYIKSINQRVTTP